MARKSSGAKSKAPRIELPPGVKPAQTRMSPQLLADIATDRGIASGGRHTIRPSTAAAARVADVPALPSRAPRLPVPKPAVSA